MSRRTARKEAFRLLYQIDIHKGVKDEVMNVFYETKSINDKDKQYIEDVVSGTISEMGYINSLIEKNAIGWKISRISKVNLAILRLAIYEILKRDDIPINVSINEAVEMAKTYDGEKAGAFVNGILGNIVKQLQQRDE